MRGKFDEYKKSLTAVAVARMSGKQMRRILGAIKFQGRSKLKVGDGSMKNAVLTAFGLVDTPAAPNAVLAAFGLAGPPAAPQT